MGFTRPTRFDAGGLEAPPSGRSVSWDDVQLEMSRPRI
jgi:hypothetical protein